jgi:hypothetical protein
MTNVKVFDIPGQPLGLPTAFGPQFDYPATLAGSTPHFRVYYETQLGSAGLTLAQGVLGNVEADYAAISTIFGGIQAPPMNVIIARVHNGGAYHYGCAATDLYCDFGTGSVSSTSFLVVAEMVEVFEAMQGRGWNCGWSNGEGLSRVLAQLRYPTEDTENLSANAWLNGGRPDFITANDLTDRNPVSWGCSCLFLNWLNVQLGFSWNEIVGAASNTLNEVYANLTDSIDGFVQFCADIAVNFPVGTPAAALSDNPFPVVSTSVSNALNERASGPISGTDFQSEAFIAWAGVSNSLNVMASGQRRIWRNKQSFQVAAQSGVSLCQFNGRLFLAWWASGGRLNIWSTGDGVNWFQQMTFSQISDASPALAVQNGQLVVAWNEGAYGWNVNLRFSSDGVNWQPKVTTPLKSKDGAAPGLASFQNRLFVASSPLGGGISVASTPDGGATWGSTVTLPEVSSDGVALQSQGAQLVLVWPEAALNAPAHQIFLRSSADGLNFAPRISLGAASRLKSPSLATCYGVPTLLWSDPNLWLSLREL